MDSEKPAGEGRSLSDREPVQVPRSQVSVKTVATASVVVLGVALVAWLIVHSMIAITITVASALLALALNHGVEFLQRRGLGRRVAMSVVVGCMLLVIAGVIWLLAPMAVKQVQQLVERAPEYLAQLRQTPAFQWISGHVNVDQQVDQLQEGGAAQQAGKAALTAVGGVAAALIGFITILFTTVFMLAFGGPMVRRLLAESLPLHRERYERVLQKVYRSVGGYLAGLGMIAALNATLMSIFLAIIRIPFFIPLGILSGLGSLIPFVGATVTGIIIGAVALATHGVWAAVAVGVYVLVYQQFENNAVVPLVYRRTVQVNPLITLVGLLFMTELAGIVGAFLAVPLIATVQIVMHELLLQRRERLNLPLKGDVAKALRSGRRFWRRREA